MALLPCSAVRPRYRSTTEPGVPLPRPWRSLRFNRVGSITPKPRPTFLLQRRKVGKRRRPAAPPDPLGRRAAHELARHDKGYNVTKCRAQTTRAANSSGLRVGADGEERQQSLGVNRTATLRGCPTAEDWILANQPSMGSPGSATQMRLIVYIFGSAMQQHLNAHELVLG